MLSKVHNAIIGLSLGYALMINSALSMEQEAKEQATREALKRAALFEQQEAEEQAARETLEKATLFQQQSAKERATREALERVALFERQEATEQATREALKIAILQEKLATEEAFRRLPEMEKRIVGMSVQNLEFMTIHKVMLFNQIIQELTGGVNQDIPKIIAAIIHASSKKIFTIPKGEDLKPKLVEIKGRMKSYSLDDERLYSDEDQHINFDYQGINYSGYIDIVFVDPILKKISINFDKNEHVEKILCVYASQKNPDLRVDFTVNFEHMKIEPKRVAYDKPMAEGLDDDWKYTQKDFYPNTKFTILPR